MGGKLYVLNRNGRPVIHEESSSRTQPSSASTCSLPAHPSRGPPVDQRQITDRHRPALYEKNPVRVVAAHRHTRSRNAIDRHIPLNHGQGGRQGDRSRQSYIKDDRVRAQGRVRIDDGLPQGAQP